ncbi:MAG TPA: hypothetical protein VHO48_11785 [Anaerolineaceae bacterium]|nr:hypothetical protein [Anaerolineaceae bacterium]
MQDLTNQAESPSLAALDHIFRTMNEAGIGYCHWKSNIHLKESLHGDTDLDLLIDPQYIPIFQQILRAHDVKAFRAAPGKEYPCISNYLGYDPASGRLFHLHVHEALVLGEQYVKNYHLPLEGEFLRETQLREGVKIPRAEVELIIFIIRILLKYRDRDGLRAIILRDLWGRKNPSGGLPKPALQEVRWLLNQTTLPQIQDQLKQWGASVPGPVILVFLQAVQEGRLNGFLLLRLRRQVRQALRSNQRSDRAEVKLRYFIEDWRQKRWIFRPRQIKKMTRAQGNLRVAFIGSDGAGKSTILRQIESWLSWRVSVKTYYMGKSQSLLATRLARAATRLARIAHTRTGRVFGENSPLTRLTGRTQRFWEDMGYFMEGWERFRSYQHSLRDARDGFVVLYDRYPLSGVTIAGHALDGPRIRARMNGHSNWLERNLASVEERWYREIVAPEHLIALQVSLAMSQSRKPEHNREMVQTKIQALDGASLNLPGMSIVPADDPLPLVVNRVKTIVWDYL